MKKLCFVLLVPVLCALATVAQVPANGPQPGGYALGIGDIVTGKVAGEADFDFTATVDEDGKFEVPFHDAPIMARCKTERDLRTELTGILAKYLRKPQLVLSVEKKRPPATIYGEVIKATEVLLWRGRASLVEVLAIAGGVKEEAGGTITVFRTQPPACIAVDSESNWMAASDDPAYVPSRTYSLANVQAGKEDSNPTIYPGDVIVVEKAPPVYITGEVVAPQGVYIKEGGLTLMEALAKIGGIRREAKTKDIKIYRLKPNSKDREVIAANYDLIRRGQQKDVLLQPYDVVEVDKARDSIGKIILGFAMGAGKAAVLSTGGAVGPRVLY
jgi:polysaccharide biosynthesis/export protein